MSLCSAMASLSTPPSFLSSSSSSSSYRHRLRRHYHHYHPPQYRRRHHPPPPPPPPTPRCRRSCSPPQPSPHSPLITITPSFLLPLVSFPSHCIYLHLGRASDSVLLHVDICKSPLRAYASSRYLALPLLVQAVR